MTLTESIRTRIHDLVMTCPTCGTELHSIYELATRAQVDHGVLRRFLSGKAIHSDTLDALATYLDKVTLPKDKP